MAKKDNMGHKGATHSTDCPMIDKYIEIRDKNSGIWYFRKRVPDKLVKAYGRIEVKCSLRTTDKHKASIRAVSKLNALNMELEELRKELEERKHRKKPETSSMRKSVDDTASFIKRFEQLTQIESKELILNEFSRLENQFQVMRNHEYRDERGRLCDKLIYAAVVEAKEDLCVHEGTSIHHEPIDWHSGAISLLNGERIDCCEINLENPCEKFVRFSDKLKCATIESYWRNVEAINGNKFAERDPFFKGLGYDTGKITDANTSPRYNRDSFSIQKLIDDFLKFKQSKVTNKTHDKIIRACRIVSDYFGEDSSVDSISVTKAEKFINYLSQIPIGFKSKSPISLQAYVKKYKSKVRLSPKSQNDLFIDVTSLFNYATDKELLNRNPFAKKMLRDQLPEIIVKKKQMLSIEEMQDFFNLEIYLAQVNTKPARFWVPLLCLFHGLRANEACQLFTSDIVQIDGVWCLNIEAGEDKQGNTKRLKNSSSKRVLPIHDELMRIGFLEYAQDKKTRRRKLLFGGLTVGKDGDKAQAVCKWFAHHRLKINREPIQRGGKAMHSLRHSFKDSLMNHGVGVEEREALGGWSSKGSSEKGYGKGFSIAKRKEAIDKVSYEGLDLEGCKEAFEKFSK